MPIAVCPTRRRVAYAATATTASQLLFAARTRDGTSSELQDIALAFLPNSITNIPKVSSSHTPAPWPSSSLADTPASVRWQARKHHGRCLPSLRAALHGFDIAFRKASVLSALFCIDGLTLKQPLRTSSSLMHSESNHDFACAAHLRYWAEMARLLQTLLAGTLVLPRTAHGAYSGQSGVLLIYVVISISMY